MKLKRLIALCTAFLFLLGSVAIAGNVTDKMTFFKTVTFKANTVLNGVSYTWPSADGTNGKVLSTNGSGVLSWTTAGAATAWDDFASPDAAKTHAMTTFAQTFTSTKTDGDMFLFQGLGAFGDVSVMRIEQKTGNATDGTVLEVVSADANVDPLVVSALNKASALVVGQDGNVSMSDNLTVGGTAEVTGASNLTGLVTAPAGVVSGTSLIKTVTVELSNAEIKALNASPKTLVAAPGAGKFIQLIGGTLILDYGSNALTESSDNLAIEYATTGVDACAAITADGFITATADSIAVAVPTAIAGAAASSFVNSALQLANNGDGEYDGNAANDTTMTVHVTYAVHDLGL